jgi:hypothetical protein
MNSNILTLYMALGSDFYLAMVAENEVKYPHEYKHRDVDLMYCAGGEL